MKAKYVVTENGPILFPFSITHDTFKSLNPTSGGFVVLEDCGKVYCYGESKSLGIVTKEDDSSLIETFFEMREVRYCD